MPHVHRGLELQIGGDRSKHGFHRVLYLYLFAWKSGHGDFALYHERFGHANTDMHCACGQKTAPRQFETCRLNQPPKSARNGQSPAIEHRKQMPGTEGLKMSMEIAAKTACFGNQFTLEPRASRDHGESGVRDARLPTEDRWPHPVP